MYQHALPELRRLGLLLVVAVVGGLVFGYLAWWVVAAFVAYTFITLTNLIHLNRWLSVSSENFLPDTEGLWGEVFAHLHHRKRREKDRRNRLRSMLDQFQRATQAMPDAVVILNLTGEITAVNKAGLTLLGLRRPEDYGRPITNFLRLPEIGTFIEEADPDATLIIDSPVRRGMSLLLQVIPYARHGQRLLIARDVTRLQRLEQVRQDFVANVSHELKSPLTVIRGYTDHLTRLNDVGEFDALGERTRDTLDRALGQVQSESERMRMLVDDLLELARLEAADADGIKNVTDVNVVNVIQRIVAEAHELSNHGHDIDQDVDPALNVSGNEREIYTAFSNILFNAVRYTPVPGHIRVSWQLIGDDPVFSVTDNGPGIPEAAIPRLTERFYRVDDSRSRSAGGTGLGLAIAKHVMLRHEGQVEIESVVDEGTTMRCRFTAARARARANVVSLTPDEAGAA